MQEDKEFQDACNEMIVGNLWNHLTFWLFMTALLLAVIGICQLTGSIPEFVNNMLGIQ